jgi:kynurenine formamidase
MREQNNRGDLQSVSTRGILSRLIAASTLVLLATPSDAQTISTDEAPQQVGTSPWGPKDEIGRLNLMTPASRSAILSRVSGQKSYDLGVDLYVGMPSWQDAGDPPYQMWMTHTPHGNVVADSMKVGEKMNRHVSYTGSAVSMYAHTGTHIDALNHFGLNGKIWNGFSETDYLGDRGWTVTGAEKLPPIVARGVLIDVATAKGLQQLPDNYRVTRKDLRDALDSQGVKLEQGDVVLIRTGRMRDYDHAQVYMANPPGLSIDGAKFLVEDGGAMVVGADNLSLETFPSEVSGNYLPVHTYLLAQQGAPIIELINLEALARDRVYQFAFIGASLKFRGGDAAPIRPIALPIK